MLEAANLNTPTYTNIIDMDFKYISPGTFIMGSPQSEAGRNSDETQHQVTLTQGFYMSTHRVTRGQWYQVTGVIPTEASMDSDFDSPATNISWDETQIFINKLNAFGDDTYRLPTEAEWEYAARADASSGYGTGNPTPGGYTGWHQEHGLTIGMMIIHRILWSIRKDLKRVQIKLLGGFPR